MSDAFEHNPGDHEDPAAGPTWMIGFISATFMLVITFGLTAIYYGALEEEVQTKFISGDYDELDELRAAQMSRLEVMRIEEREENGQRYDALVIPIESAMQLTVREYASQP